MQTSNLSAEVTTRTEANKKKMLNNDILFFNACLEFLKIIKENNVSFVYLYNKSILNNQYIFSYRLQKEYIQL